MIQLHRLLSPVYPMGQPGLLMFAQPSPLASAQKTWQHKNWQYKKPGIYCHLLGLGVFPISIPISHFPYMEFASLSAQLSSLLQLFKLLCFVIVFKLDKGSSLNYSASTQVLDWVKPYHYETYLPFLSLRYCVKSNRNLSIPGQSSRRLSPC